MNRGVYQFHLRRIAEGKELLDKIRELIAKHRIQNDAQLLTHLSEVGVQTDLQTVSRERQGLQVKTTSYGTYALPDEREIQEKRQQVDGILNQYAVDVHDRVEFLAIQTPAGHEESVASTIEGGFEQRILGTVLGRGLVFVVAENDNVGKEALQEIRSRG